MASTAAETEIRSDISATIGEKRRIADSLSPLSTSMCSDSFDPADFECSIITISLRGVVELTFATVCVFAFLAPDFSS